MGLGTPTLKDLTEDEGKVYWEGMEALAAAGDHVAIKISMLCYTDPKWDENAVVTAAVHRIIKLFTPARCFFASNYPVDLLPDQGSWTPDKLYPAFQKLVENAGYDDETVRGFFCANVKRVYRV